MSVMLCGWEGILRSSFTVAMCHRLNGLSAYGLNGLYVGDEHLPKSHWGTASLPLAFYLEICARIFGCQTVCLCVVCVCVCWTGLTITVTSVSHSTYLDSASLTSL